MTPRNYVLSGGIPPTPGGTTPTYELNCSAPVNGSAWRAGGGNCAWAALLVPTAGWLNASVSADGGGGSRLVLTAALPAEVGAADATVVASAYGWGPVPLMSAYDVETGLPVLPWYVSV